MILPPDLLAGADADLQKLFNRLEDFRGGSGGESLAEVDAYLTGISAFPRLAPVYFESIRRQSSAKNSVPHLLHPSQKPYRYPRDPRFETGSPEYPAAPDGLTGCWGRNPEAELCNHALGQWARLIVYTSRGEVEIDNNWCEHAMRTIKNSA